MTMSEYVVTAESPSVAITMVISAYSEYGAVFWMECSLFFWGRKPRDFIISVKIFVDSSR